MRKTLTAAAALAPLWFMVGADVAWSTTTISTGRTTPISTSTANNGAPDDIDIATGGSITLTSPTSPAVTLNSNNSVKNEGTITFTDVNNAIGVLVSGGQTGSFHNTGSIVLNESTKPTDTNSDGVLEAPYAQGSAKYGVLVQGASPFTGDVSNDSGGSIAITGNNSYGISVEAPLTGNLLNGGTITLTGNNGAGLRETAGVSGNVLVTGVVTTTGQNTSGVVLSGDVNGRFGIYSAITSTGYGTSTRNATNATQALIQSQASQLQQGGPAVVIGANINGGVYMSAQPTNTASTSTADVDGDGVADGTQGTGAITVFGSAPALLVGAAGRNVAIGPVVFTTTPANPYGLILNGSVAGNGIDDGINANGVQIGVANGTVNIAGGIHIGGAVNALSYGANATGLAINAGSTVPTVDVSGALSAITAQPLPNATTGVATPHNGASTALVIAAGATVNTLNVDGAILAETTGDLAANSATAVIDNSGTLSTINLTNTITAEVAPTVTTVTSAGAATALDLRANTTGVTLNMNQAAQKVTTVVTNSDNTTTTTTTAGPVVQNTTGAAITTAVTTGTTTVTTVTPKAPVITGDIYLGSGPNTVNQNAGIITGALSLGSGNASYTLNNGATYSGKLSYTGPALALNIANGSLTTTNAVTYNASSLNIGATSTLVFAIDPVNHLASNFLVSGTASIAAGAKLGVNLLSTLTGPQTYTLIKATTLTVGGADATLAADVPYLFYAAVQSNPAAGLLNLTIRQKTASELGLNQAEAAALPAIYTALPGDTAIQSALFAQYQRPGFIGLYDQLLPDYAGGVFRAASAASRTISRLTAEPNQIENPTGSRGAWAQQFFIGAEQSKGSTAGFRDGGFGYVGGVETGGTGFGAVGATAAFVAVNIGDPHTPGDNNIGMSELEGGLYWQGETSGYIFDARLGAGYNWFSGRRQFLQTDSTGLTVLSRKTKASWNGYSLSGHVGAAYQADLSPIFFVRPEVKLDYFRLNESSYTETNGGNGFNLAVDSRTGDEASGTASMVFGAKLGRGFVWRPQLEVGLREVFTGDAGATTARFAAGGSNFTVNPADITGVSGLARFKLKASSEYYEVGVEAGGEAKSGYTEGDVKMTFRVLF